MKCDGINCRALLGTSIILLVVVMVCGQILGYEFSEMQSLKNQMTTLKGQVIQFQEEIQQEIQRQNMLNKQAIQRIKAKKWHR